MAWDFEITTTQTARKTYRCDAMEWIDNSMSISEFTEDEKAIVLKAKSDKNKILKGTVYIKTKGKWDGDFAVFRARPEINSLCIKYNLYQEYF